MIAVLQARKPTGEIAYAAVDPAAHHVEGAIADRRFSAFLTPFRCLEDATTALMASGGVDVRPADRAKAARRG